ncbi:MAG: AMP-binding protein [Candidatus Eremiobacteraeota bacterium]|nr:AMP-binding protein [Candidatus Eremiobacteraeota bacterium]
MNSRNPDTERLYWPADQVRQYQLDKLRETVARASRSTYYRPRLTGLQVDTLEDLRRLPLTPKEDSRAASPLGLLAVEPDQLFQYHESYGTTGTPTSSWLTRGDFQNYATQINHAAANLHGNDRVLVRFPYAISVPAHIVTQAAHNRDACVIPVSSRTAIAPYPRVIDLLGKLQATVICCLPMEAIWLAETARQMGKDPASDFPNLRALLVAGELLSDARRARIAELWHVEIYNLYGCTEGGNIAADCDAGRLHLSWDHFILETLDEKTRQPVRPGELGAAVLTTLTRQAMPLVRFLLGDYLRLRDGHSCPCGREAPVIEHYGRDLNCFDFCGRRYFVRDLEDRLLTIPAQALSNLWLVEVRPNEVRFRAEAANPDPVLYRQLQERVRDELRLPLVIEPVAPGTLLNRARLAQVEPVNKPRVVGIVPTANGPPLTLDDLM